MCSVYITQEKDKENTSTVCLTASYNNTVIGGNYPCNGIKWLLLLLVLQHVQMINSYTINTTNMKKRCWELGFCQNCERLWDECAYSILEDWRLFPDWWIEYKTNITSVEDREKTRGLVLNMSEVSVTLGEFGFLCSLLLCVSLFISRITQSSECTWMEQGIKTWKQTQIKSWKRRGAQE